MTIPGIAKLPRVAGLVVAVMVMALAVPLAMDSAENAQAASVPPGAIVYIKDHNVWLMKGDGSGKYQVTRNGRDGYGYSSPTQSDGGVIAAALEDEVVLMKQNGQEIIRLNPPPIEAVPGHPQDGFVNSAAISPDGKRLVYSNTTDGCFVVVGCHWRTVTGYTDTNALSPITKYGTTYYKTPSWVTNTRTIESRIGTTQMLHDVGKGSDEAPGEAWFWAADLWDRYGDLTQGEVSRNGKYYLVRYSDSDLTSVILFKINGNARTGPPPAHPTQLCMTNSDEKMASPTWAPDTSAYAFEAEDGIWTIGMAENCTGAAKQIAPRGEDQHWSPAALNPPPRVVPPATQASFARTGLPTISGTATVGSSLKATNGGWTPKPTSYGYQWKRNGAAIKGATASKYKLGKADAGKRITVTVTAKRAAYKNASATSKVTRVALHATRKPAIKGAAKVGRTLKAKVGKWTPKPSKYSYQWYRGSKAIKKATRSSYTLTKVDRKHKIRVRVVDKRAGYVSGKAYSKVLRVR